MMALLDVPDLVMMKVIKYCSHNLEDIHSLRVVNKRLQEFIDINWNHLFHTDLFITNSGVNNKLDLSKPVLNMVISVKQVSLHNDEFEVTKLNAQEICNGDNFLIIEDDSGKREPLVVVPRAETALALLENSLVKLNLRNLLSLEIKFDGHNCFKYPYHYILLHKELKKIPSLKQLMLSVDFLCGYCTEYVANIGTNCPQILFLNITNMVHHSKFDLDIFVPLSTAIFETFSKESNRRQTLVSCIPVHLLPEIQDWAEEGEHYVQVFASQRNMVTLKFGG